MGWGNNVSCLAFSHGWFPCSSTDATWLPQHIFIWIGWGGGGGNDSCLACSNRCYATVLSLALSHALDATSKDLLLHLHSCWMLRHRIAFALAGTLEMLRHRSFSCNCTCTGCYVKGFFVLHLHIHWMPRFTIFCCFYTHWMLRHRIFSCKDYLLKHMCMKCKEKGHTKMHPSVPDYIYMWCWRQFQNNCTMEISGKAGRIALTTAMAIKWCQINFVKSKHHQNQLLVVVKLYTCFATFACNDHIQNTTTWLHVKTGVAAHLTVTKYIESPKRHGRLCTAVLVQPKIVHKKDVKTGDWISYQHGGLVVSNIWYFLGWSLMLTLPAFSGSHQQSDSHHFSWVNHHKLNHKSSIFQFAKG